MPRDGLNTTVSDAASIKGTNPQFLIEKITRMKIYEDMYWKEHCFALNAEGIVDKAVELKYVGGTYGGNRRPSEFMCLLLKMLQIQPEKSIILEFIMNNDYKYVRVLGATYLRLTGNAIEIYQYLEPLLIDFRKICYRNIEAKYEIRHVDEIIDELLVGNTAFDIALPRLPLRWHLEKAGKLPERKSKLEEMDFFDDDEEEKEEFLELEKEKSKAKAIAWNKSGADEEKKEDKTVEPEEPKRDKEDSASAKELSDDSHKQGKKIRKKRDDSRDSSRSRDSRSRDRSRERDRRRRDRNRRNRDDSRDRMRRRGRDRRRRSRSRSRTRRRR